MRTLVKEIYKILHHMPIVWIVYRIDVCTFDSRNVKVWKELALAQLLFGCCYRTMLHGSQMDWKTWKNGRTFSSQGKDGINNGKVSEISGFPQHLESLENHYPFQSLKYHGNLKF